MASASLKIPRTFELAGRTWRVKRVGKRSWYGRTNAAECVIHISSKSKDAEEELHTFLHELMHAIAWAMGWDKMFRDETRIDALSSLLLQVLETSKGKA
jgi:hypothetical protein